MKPKSLAPVLLACFLIAVRVAAQDRLIFAADVIRHGDRTPLDNPFKEDPANWPEGFGTLTSLGTNQEFALGAEMGRLHYRGLLEATTAANAVRVYSTDTDRTRASARMFLTGLLGGASRSISIYLTIPTNLNGAVTASNGFSTGLVLNPDNTPNLQSLQTQYVFRTAVWMATNAALEPRFARWGRALDLRINTVQDLMGLGDAMYIHQLHQVPMTNRLSPEEVEAIIAAGRWAFVYQYNPDIGRVTGRLLLKTLSDYMENARREELSRNQTTLKYVLFSAHDNTLLSAMSALRAPLQGTNSPPYASLLHFGLFQSGRTNFYLQVSYKSPAERAVPDPESGGATWTLEHLSNLARP